MAGATRTIQHDHIDLAPMPRLEPLDGRWIVNVQVSLWWPTTAAAAAAAAADRRRSPSGNAGALQQRLGTSKAAVSTTASGRLGPDVWASAAPAETAPAAVRHQHHRRLEPAHMPDQRAGDVTAVRRAPAIAVEHAGLGLGDRARSRGPA